MTAASSQLELLGFPPPLDVGGLKSIAHMFGSSKRRCGIYLLVLPENRYYIGQAIDVVRRFGQHIKTHERIEAFAFVPTSKARLDAREKELIFEAERAGLTLVNVVHVSDVDGESDLDALVSPEELAAWIKDPTGQNGNDFATDPIVFSEAHGARFASNYNRFRRSPFFVTCPLPPCQCFGRSPG